jgi:large subunit ribosomal protein L4
MSKIPVKNSEGRTVGEVDLPDQILVAGKGDAAVHDAITAFRANLRVGTANTKGKGAVAGSGKKPWKQKGTGRARAGYVRSPVWRGGGVAHGPHPRDYTWDLPRQQSRLAFRRAFSTRVEESAVSVLEDVAIAEPKTRLVAGLARSLGAEKGLLIIVDSADPKLALAARNLPRVEVALAKDVCTYSLLRWPSIVVTKAGLAALEKRLTPRRKAV